jgi:hypothetical protein
MSDDPVVDFMVMEGIATKVGVERKKAERQEEARRHRADHRKMADPALRGKVNA